MRERAKLVHPCCQKLSVRKQCDLLNVNRNKICYKPREVKPEDVQMMHIMDKHSTVHPTEGVESMADLLRDLGYPIGPKRVRRMFRLMGRQTLYRRRNLTKSGLRQFIKPYLLRGLKIIRPNQVWCTDITYVPMKNGFMYLTAIIDVYSRKILGWSISNSLDTSWCMTMLEETIKIHGLPEILHSDQGTQYRSARWTHYLRKPGIKISMDRKVRALDNIRIGRFWKSIKNDYICLNPAEDGFKLNKGVQNHIACYKNKIQTTTRQKPNIHYQETIQKAA